MKIIFSNQKKKSAIEIGLVEIMGAFIGILILLSMIYIGAKLYGLFSTNKDYDSTLENFEVLESKIKALLEQENHANTNILYFLDKDYALVGFNYLDKLEMETCEKRNKYLIFKESTKLTKVRETIRDICGESCICLFKNKKVNDLGEDALPLKCITFDKDIVFLAPKYQNEFCSIDTSWSPSVYPEYYPSETHYKFLILQGFNTREIYLDRYESKDGVTFIYFAIYNHDPNSEVYKRKKFMDIKLGQDKEILTA